MQYEIDPRWLVVADASEVRAGFPTVLRRFGERWVLGRDALGTVVASAERCTHRSAICLECIEAADSVELVVREAHGWIWAWTGEPGRFVAPIEHLAEVSPERSWSTASAVWGEEHAHAWAHALELHPMLRYQDPRVPNLRSGTVGDRTHVLAVVPIDDTRTKIYVRTYEPEGLSPVLTWSRRVVRSLRDGWRLRRAQPGRHASTLGLASGIPSEARASQ